MLLTLEELDAYLAGEVTLDDLRGGEEVIDLAHQEENGK